MSTTAPGISGAKNTTADKGVLACFIRCGEHGCPVRDETGCLKIRHVSDNGSSIGRVAYGLAIRALENP